MQPWLIAIIVICSLCALSLIIFLVGAILSEKAIFNKRADRNPLLKYYTAEDFNLNAQPVALKRGELNGYLYTNPQVKQNGKLIVFCHGMGPGHIAYTTEIAYFCNCGFTVLAVDNRGCNLSVGNMKGMYSGIETATIALNFARTDQRLKEKPLYLIGHSWGGYSALCASVKCKVDGVVAIGAPDTPAKTMSSGAAPLIGNILATILRPFWYVVNLFKFGFKGNSSAAKCASKNNTPTLIIHGDSDNMVTLKCSAYKRAKGAHITKYLAKGKAHNPYNTPAAEQKLAELTKNLMSAAKMTEEQKQACFGNFDYAAATEEDQEVMQTIVDFLNK